MSKERQTHVVGNMSEWSGMLRDLFRQINDGSLTKDHIQKVLEHRNPFSTSHLYLEWQKFYRKYFQLNVDFSKTVIPDDPGGFSRVVFIPQGLTFFRLIKALRKQFDVSLYTGNLDKSITENVRTPNQNYAIRLHDQLEADEDLRSLSANQLEKRGLNCITLLEMLVFELKFWSETCGHLNWLASTLCAGSRGPNSIVPCVHRDHDNGGLRVNWCLPAGADVLLRARQVVSN